MSQSFEARASELFLDATELPEEQRAAFLERSAGQDAALHARVEQLLSQEAAMPALFLEGQLHQTAHYLEAGSSFAGFHILRRLGEGGMGTVYAAQQSMPRREVALKVIRPGRMSSRAQRRFRHEVEVLGNLQHPGIAQIYEAGTGSTVDEDGRQVEQPYLAMELVRGQPLLTYARTQALDIAARLELMARLCDAIQHAHQRSVIHRDLKPDNVLVTTEETTLSGAQGKRRNAGRPMILDFGIARVLDEESTAEASETRAGELLGTLAYMSPEQLGGDRSRVDVRSDVYSLGVILYQLLTDRLPIDLHGENLAGALHKLEREQAEPIERRFPALRGNIAIIAHKALAKDPAARYQSAFELACELRRHLAGEPIHARSDSALYLMRQRLRKNRRALLLACVACVPLGGFAIAFARQAHASGALARSEADARVQADIDYDFAVQAIDLLTEVGQNRLQNVPQAEAARREMLEASLAFFSDLLARDDKPELVHRTSLARLWVGKLHLKLGEYERASQEAAKFLESSAGTGAMDAEIEIRVSAFGLKGTSARRSGDKQSSLQAFLAMQQLAATHLDLEASWAARQLATAKKFLAILREDEGDYASAEAKLVEALEIMQRFDPEGSMHVEDRGVLADILMQLGTVRYKQRRYTEAEADLGASLLQVKILQRAENGAVRRLFDEQQLANNLGLVAGEDGRPEVAGEHYRHAIALGQRLVEDHPGVPRYAESLFHGHNNLAALLKIEGDFEGALVQLDLAAAVLDRLSKQVDDEQAPIGPRMLQRANAGLILSDLERYDEALVRFKSAFELAKGSGRSEPLALNDQAILDFARVNYARALLLMGDLHGTLEAIGSVRVRSAQTDMMWALDAANSVMLQALEDETLSDAGIDELMWLAAVHAGDLVARSRGAGFAPASSYWDDLRFELLVEHEEFRQRAGLQ